MQFSVIKSNIYGDLYLIISKKLFWN